MPWLGAALIPEHTEPTVWLCKGETLQASPGVLWVVPWSGVWSVTWIVAQQRAAERGET